MSWFFRVLLINYLILFTVVNSMAVDTKPALVVIDMQTYFILRNENYGSTESQEKLQRVLEKQIELIEYFKSQNLPIVHVEYEKFRFGPTEPVLLEALGAYKKLIYTEKPMEGFMNKKCEDCGVRNLTYEQQSNKLREELNTYAVNTLIIVGANGASCVYSSILDALKWGYTVITVNDATIDFNGDYNVNEFIYPYKFSKKEAEKFDKICSSFWRNKCKFIELDKFTPLTPFN